MDVRNGDINIDVLNMLNTKYVVTGDTSVSVNPGAMGNAWFVDRIDYVASPAEEMQYLDSFTPAIEAVADKKFEAVLGGGAVPAKMPGDTIFETSYAPNRLTYHANSQNGGLAVFSEIYFPWGWNATIDGAPAEIGRVNYVLRALRIPAGSHTITFSFEPKSVSVTETLAYISIVVIFLAVLAAVAVNVVGNKSVKREEAL